MRFQFQPPTSIGLIRFSFISQISLLRSPTELYNCGIQYPYIMGGIITMGSIMMHIYLPAFHKLAKHISEKEVNLTPRTHCLFYSPLCTSQCLQSSFDKKMRLLDCIFFIFLRNMKNWSRGTAFSLFKHKSKKLVKYFSVEYVQKCLQLGSTLKKNEVQQICRYNLYD